MTDRSSFPPPARRFPALRDLLAVASLWAAVALFFWKLLCTNLILTRGDTLLYIYPYWTAAAAALRAGHLPLWNPTLFMGAPFLANSQAGLLYPLNWPLWLLFDTPSAASLSIVLHLWLAAAFCYGFARAGLRLRRSAAWLAAVLFSLGGYLTAQVEHVNQLQGLAWLPAVAWLLTGDRMRARSFLLGGVLALQVLAGHTQAAFITIVGAALYAAWLSASTLRSEAGRPSIGRLRVTQLAIALLIATLLSAAQLLPTLELSRHSVRGGSGLPLNEAVSFSFHPLLAGRALLPGYGETIYSEYVAFLPLSAILLAIYGLWNGRHKPAVVALSLVGAAGLFLALGAANPVYRLLVRMVPGFGLFRAPARWLALYALGAAGLAGVGLDALLARRAPPLRPSLVIGGLVLLALVSWAFVAPSLTHLIPAPPESPVRPPSTITLVGWLAEALLALGIICGASFISARSKVDRQSARLSAIPLAALSLFLSSRALPYNNPTAPEAYSALRPALAHLLAASDDSRQQSDPPGRFLSISNIFFDPGDTGELTSIFGDQLDADSFYDLIIATKQKEILAPNLPLTFGVPAVDGYDGGVLPLSSYVTLERLFLPADALATDGRLRENLGDIPDGRWMNLFNVRYVITDKVGDAWADDVYYDLQHGAVLDSKDPAVSVAHLPPFEATGLGLVSNLEGGASMPNDSIVAEVTVHFAGGDVETLPLRAGEHTAEGRYSSATTAHPQTTILRTNSDGTVLYVGRLRWAKPGAPTAITITHSPTLDASYHIHGLSLLDERDGAFQSLVVSGNGRYRLVHSGDVKIYENLDTLPRAFLVSKGVWVPDEEAGLQRMTAAEFDPAGEVVLIGKPDGSSVEKGPLPGVVRFTAYRPDRVELQVEAAGDGWLVLSDAHYPGWEATVDGEPVTVERADILFRAVPVRAGRQEVVFAFRPGSVWVGALVSAVSLAGWLIGWIRVRRED